MPHEEAVPTPEAVSEPEPVARPVETAERISSVDVLRGFALLGILLMNIQNFGIPGPAYGNPSAWAGDTGWNLYYWVANQILFEGKMRFLFSMLFGASTVLLTDRALSRGAGVATADIYLRRCLWMMLIGIVHAYVIWDGDILYLYGLVGLGLFVFRVLSVKGLLIAAGVVFVFSNLMSVGYFMSEKSKRDDGIAALKVEEKKRTKEQKKAVEAYQEVLDGFDMVKRRERVEQEIKEIRGNWLTIFKQRAPHVFSFQTTGVAKFGLHDVLFAMLLGMAFYKAGVLSGDKPLRFYLGLAGAGYLLGLPLLTWQTVEVWKSHWDPWLADTLVLSYEYGRLTVGMAHLGVVMAIYKLGWLKPVTYLLSQVGQMALTNYLLTSVLMSLFFNGYGFGKFGALERHQLLYVVFGMWTINLTLSPVWLKYFRFGPVEWVWRSLTYWKRQPLRIAVAPIPAAEVTAVEGN